MTIATERTSPVDQLRNRVVLVTARSFSTGHRDLAGELAADGAEVLTGPSDHHLGQLAPLLARADAWIAGTGPVSDAHLAAGPNLRVIARYGVGTDAVDLAAAARRNIVVANTPGANSGAVADHTLALLLTALRGVTAGDRGVRSGNWSVTRTRELSGMTVGIVGFGRIGRGVAARLTGFGSRILVSDPFVDPAAITAAGAEAVSPDELAARSDIVSLHSPGEALLVDKQWLAAARSGLLLVNTARAQLVDEQALAAALRAGRLSGYAADTLAGERATTGSPLLADDLRDRVVVTPHSAAQTFEAVDLMGSVAVQAVRAVLNGRRPDHPVRAEEVGR